MIFDEIVAEVSERLNLTSDEAKSRIGREVNARYKRIVTSIGLETTSRVTLPATATIGSTVMTFTGIQKILAVIDRSSGTDVMLSQVTPDEFHILPVRGEPPRHFAITNITSNSVVIEIDCVPSTAFTLYVDAIESKATLAGAVSPAFPDSFHDVLIFGAMADEYRKMEKLEFSRDAEASYEQRLSDLRMFIAKSAYLDISQGRYSGKNFRWTRDAQLLWDN
jgi:hypothetical protein